MKRLTTWLAAQEPGVPLALVLTLVAVFLGGVVVGLAIALVWP